VYSTNKPTTFLLFFYYKKNKTKKKHEKALEDKVSIFNFKGNKVILLPVKSEKS
jgi:hypothetical protein